MNRSIFRNLKNVGSKSYVCRCPATSINWFAAYQDMVFELHGDSLKLYLNDTEVVSAADSSIAEGYAGLYAYSQQVYYDDIEIQDMP